MHKLKYAALLAVIVLALFLAYEYANANSRNMTYASSRALDSAFPVGRIMIGNSAYSAYVANGTELQQRGYMNATGIGDCRGIGDCAGMLFLFSNDSVQCFWMKNTYFGMDQSWISDGRIDYIYEGIPLSTNMVCMKGSMVLETNVSFPLHLGENVSFAGYATG